MRMKRRNACKRGRLVGPEGIKRKRIPTAPSSFLSYTLFATLFRCDMASRIGKFVSVRPTDRVVYST